jgi:hypothetical protein
VPWAQDNAEPVRPGFLARDSFPACGYPRGMPDGVRRTIHPLWRRYRRWWVALGIASALSVGFAIVLRGRTDLAIVDPRAWPPLAAFLGMGVAALQILNFRCPACGRQFHSRWQGMFPRPRPLSKRCLNCGFPKWRDPPSRVR